MIIYRTSVTADELWLIGDLASGLQAMSELKNQVLGERNAMDDSKAYGPLKQLIGVWEGSDGADISPEPDGTESNPYYETLEFSEADCVDNAEEQHLVALHYRQVVSRKTTKKVFHQETGFIIWDENAGQIIKTLAIPRGLSLVAGSSPLVLYSDQTGFEFEVFSAIDDADWKIANGPFLQTKARTLSYRHKMTVSDNRLSYQQTMMLAIYGREFEHTDQNELIRRN